MTNHTDIPLQDLESIDLKNPEFYFNRELSLLAFHQRVFEQARNPDHPLLERLRFLCITSSNLDEFFEVRVAGKKQQAEAGVATTEADNCSPRAVLTEISLRAHKLIDEQYQLLNDVLLPELEQAGIRFLRRDQLNDTQRTWMRDYFQQQLSPVITPLRLDPAHPFPRILNKSLNFIISLTGEDAFGREGGMAVVQAPRALPRIIRIPDEATDGNNDLVFLSSIIHAHVGEFFPGMQITGCYQFRLTRNSDLFVDPEEIDDLLRAMEGELPSRRYGEAVRLEVADNCPESVSDFLLNQFHMNEEDLYQVNGPVNLNRLIALPDMVNRPELSFPPFVSGMPEGITQGCDLFAAIRHADILLHHPFQSFIPVVDLVRQAAKDPNVLVIKQTLYRTGDRSALVSALEKAARSGKEVTVCVELRARFDEQANIDLANRLQAAGAHVVYGVVGYKTHAKMLMIVRRERQGLRRYVHLGTGNYHARTAKTYTDYGLMTCDPDTTADVHQIFLQLTSLGRGPTLNNILQSPFTLFDGLIQRIEREAEHAKAGRKTHIIAKMNALVEPRIIRSLYQASQAGVKIDLIIRGICCLRPGLPGVSENIQVRSIVGRFLEHTRLNYFLNDGAEEVLASSADWMPRNLFYRVEACFPIQAPKSKTSVIEQGLKTYLNDNTNAWILNSTGEYQLDSAEDQEHFSAQNHLIDKLSES